MRLWDEIALRRQALNPRVQSRLKRSFLIYAGLVLLAGWTYSAWYIATEHARTLDIARQQLRMLSNALTVQMEAMLGDGLGAAQASFIHLQRQGGLEHGDAALIAARLTEDVTGGEYVRALFFSSAHRTVIGGRGGYRQVMQGQPAWLSAVDPAAKVALGEPMPYPPDPAKHVIPIAQRRTTPDGEPVWAGFWLGVEEVRERYTRIGLDHRAIALVRADGALITGASGVFVAATSRTDIRSSELFRQIVSSRPLPRIIEGVSPFDFKEKLFAVSRADGDVPLYISVAIEREAVLSVWWHRALNVLWMSLGASAVLIVLTALLYRFMAEINRREIQFLKLFETSLASILLLKDGQVVEYNRTARSVFRLPPGRAMRGLSPLEFSPQWQADGERSIDAFRRTNAVLQREGGITFRWLFKRFDTQEPFEAEVNLSTIQIAEDAVTLAIIRDISDLESARRELQDANVKLELRVAQRTQELQRANAQLAAANRELEEFTASASHELRSPLGVISGQAGMLEVASRDALGAEGKTRIQKIDLSVKRAADVIDGLLSLARITRQDLLRERVSLSTTARKIVDELRESDPGRALDSRIEPDMWVCADPRLMDSLLRNLLNNAWKYSAQQPRVSIEVERRRNGDEVVYCVSDHGAGFNMMYADRLFRAFRRLHSSEEFSGIGIGLAIVARIVIRYGGRVWAQGKEGAGAQFFFTLPLAEEGQSEDDRDLDASTDKPRGDASD